MSPSFTFTITSKAPDTPHGRVLIDELEAHLAPQYPDESRHGYSIEKLLHEGVHFFIARYRQEPAGCGGVQYYGTAYGEVKRMYVRPAYRRHGLARQLLDALCNHARDKGVSLLRLETGIHQQPAIRLYEQYGFQRIPPFGEYTDDPLSLYFELIL